MKYILIAFIGLFLSSNTAIALEKASPDQNDKVQKLVQELVPYNLKQTLQTFSKTVHGGIMHVVAKSANDGQQIKLIQANLLKTANDYKKGDYSVTERIHGADMPGLAQLKTAETNDIKFEYKALPDGAQIHFSSEYPLFVDALHEWFDAQISDHGNAVIPGHAQHHSTPVE